MGNFFKKFKKRLAAGALLAAIAAASVNHLKTEHASVERELVKVETVIKQEQAKARRTNLTWADVRRTIAADVKQKQQLKNREAELIKDEAYFEAMAQKFLAMAKEEKVLRTGGDFVMGIDARINGSVSSDNKAILFIKEDLDKWFVKLLNYALLSESERQLLNKGWTGSGELTLEESTEFEALAAFHGENFIGMFEQVKAKFIAEWRETKDYYYSWVEENDALRKSIKKLVSFIRHNQLERVLNQELQALQKLDGALEKQNLELAQMIHQFDKMIEEASALQPSYD